MWCETAHIRSIQTNLAWTIRELYSVYLCRNNDGLKLIVKVWCVTVCKSMLMSLQINAWESSSSKNKHANGLQDGFNSLCVIVLYFLYFRSLSELDSLRLTGEAGDKIRQVTERATLFRITSNAMINASVVSFRVVYSIFDWCVIKCQCWCCLRGWIFSNPNLI